MTPAASLLQRAPRALRTGADVISPCVSVCRMGDDGLCAGCLRTLAEIAGWSRLDDAGRRVVWTTIVERARRQLHEPST
jgi:predicted Fe-S protein YdhL (DUF1289 family)